MDAIDPLRVVPVPDLDKVKKPAGPIFRFAKNVNPREKIPLKSGSVVEWHIPVIGGIHQGFGTFETDNKELAKELREFAEKNPGWMIFETSNPQGK